MLSFCAFRRDYPRPKRARIFGRVHPPSKSRITGNICLINTFRRRTVSFCDYDRVKQSPDPTFLLQIDIFCEEGESPLPTSVTKADSLNDIIKSFLSSFSQKQEILFFIPITIEPTLSTSFVMSALHDATSDYMHSVKTLCYEKWNSLAFESNLADLTRPSSTSTFVERDEDGMIEENCMKRTWDEAKTSFKEIEKSTLNEAHFSDIGVKLLWTTFLPVRSAQPMLKIAKPSSAIEQCMILDVSQSVFAELKQYDEDADEEIPWIALKTSMIEARDLIDITDQQMHLLSYDEHKSSFVYKFQAEVEEDLSEFHASSINKAASMLSKPWLITILNLTEEFSTQILKLTIFADKTVVGSNIIFTETTLPNHIPIKVHNKDSSTIHDTNSHLVFLKDLRRYVTSMDTIAASHWNNTAGFMIDDEKVVLFDVLDSSNKSTHEKHFFELVNDAFCPGIPVLLLHFSPAKETESTAELVDEQAAERPVLHETISSLASSLPQKGDTPSETENKAPEQEEILAAPPSISVAPTARSTSVAEKRTCAAVTNVPNKRIRLDNALLGVDSVDAYLILRDQQQHHQQTSATLPPTTSAGITSAFLANQPKPVPSLSTASMAAMMDTKASSAHSPPPVMDTFLATRMGGLQILVADDLYEKRTDLISALHRQYEIICKDFVSCDGVMFVISECTAIVFLDVDTWSRPDYRRNWLLNMSRIALRYATVWVMLKVPEANVNEANYSSLLVQLHMSLLKFPCRVIVRECLANDVNIEVELIVMICQVDVKASQERDDRSLTTYKRRRFFNLLDREFIAATCDFLQHFPTVNLYTALLLVLTHENMPEIAKSTAAQVQERLRKVSPNADLLAEMIHRFMQVMHAQLN